MTDSKQHDDFFFPFLNFNKVVQSVSRWNRVKGGRSQFIGKKSWISVKTARFPLNFFSFSF